MYDLVIVFRGAETEAGDSPGNPSRCDLPRVCGRTVGAGARHHGPPAPLGRQHRPSSLAPTGHLPASQVPRHWGKTQSGKQNISFPGGKLLNYKQLHTDVLMIKWNIRSAREDVSERNWASPWYFWPWQTSSKGLMSASSLELRSGRIPSTASHCRPTHTKLPCSRELKKYEMLIAFNKHNKIIREETVGRYTYLLVLISICIYS